MTKPVSILSLLVVVSLLIGGCAVSSTVKAEKFVQDKLAVGFWFDPPADRQMAKRYAEIADANFTLTLGGFGAKTESAVKKQLDLCEKHGMKALVHVDGYSEAVGDWDKASKTSLPKADSIKDHPACWGYMLGDEPSAGAFPKIRRVVDHLKKTRPGKVAFINLFPNYCPAWGLGTKDYEEYVTRFIDEVGPEVLSFDHYPEMQPTGDTRPNYCENLRVFRDASLKHDIPFWVFFSSMPFDSHTDPTEAQIRWQIYTALAYGAKGVLYFCYWSPGGPHGTTFAKGGAVITNEGRRTRHYEQAQRINGILKNWDPTFMKLTSTGVYRIPPDKDSVEILKGSPVKSITKGDFIIGAFKHQDGRRAVMLTNYDYSFTTWPTVEFDVADDKVIEVDPRSGKEVPAIDDSPAVPGLQLSMESGEGRLFILP